LGELMAVVGRARHPQEGGSAAKLYEVWQARRGWRRHCSV